MQNNQNLTLFKIIFNSDIPNYSRTFDYYLPMDTFTRQVYLNPVLEFVNSRGLSLKDAQIFHVDFVNKVNVFLGVYPFNQQVKISSESVVNNSIQINLKGVKYPAGEMIDEQIQQIENVKITVKSKKVKERTIIEAMEAVKLWRAYYDTPDTHSGRRLYTLDEAARQVGIAKKTLDDYYNHIRIAQQFDFNLSRFSQAKVGILRRFVKIAKQGGSEAILKQMPEYLLDNNIEKYWINFSEL